MQDMVVHSLNLVGAMGLTKPHLMGHSMGGWVAPEIAVVAGDHFDKLVLNMTAGLNHPDQAATDLGAVAPQELPGYLAHLVDVAVRYFPGGPECLPLKQFPAGRAREGAALGNILKPFGMGHPNPGRWLGRIQNQTLVIRGDRHERVPDQFRHQGSL